MSQNTQKKSTEQIVEAIFALDLDPIKFKLMDKKEGEGWTRAEADRHELEYKRFLALLAKYPNEPIAPSSTVDKFWHGHILDTMKYAEDCERVFGYFVHHFPYFGMRGAEDAANLASAAERTQHLYAQEFGAADSAGPSSWCGRAAAKDTAWCGRAVAKDAAWCGRAVDKETAWCGRAVAKNTAWCGRAVAKDTAWCGRAASKDAAWCGAAGEAKDAYDIVVGPGRPVLEAADAR